MAQEDKFVVPHRKPAVGKSTVVSVRLPDTMLAKLENVATQTGRTRNELVQMCIDYALPGWRSPKNDKSSLPARRLLSVCMRNYLNTNSQ